MRQQSGTDRPRIVIVTNLFPTPVDPERGIFLAQMTKHLARKCDLTVVCPLPWMPSVPFVKGRGRWSQFMGIPPRYEVEKVSVISSRYPMIPALSESFHARIMARSVRKTLAELTKSGPIDLVNSHWLYPDGVAVQLAISNWGMPHIPSGRGCDVNDYPSDPVKGPQIMTMLGRAEHIAVVSDDLKKNIIALGIDADRVTSIPNGLALERFIPENPETARTRLGLSNDRRYILYVGRFSEEKNVDVLIEAAGNVLAAQPDVNLIMVGDGPMRGQLVSRARQLGIHDRVLFPGRQSHEVIVDWINSANCLCLPSKREGSPNVVLEALACGVPVVASRVGSIPNLVGDGTGKLVEAGNADDLASKLASTLADSWDRPSIARSVADRSWENVAAEYMLLYRTVLDRRKKV